MMKRMMVMWVAVVLCVSVAQAGVSYSAVTRSKDARGREKEVSKMRAVVDGAKARIDIAAHNGPVPKGGYLLTRDSGKTVYLINPQEKSYMVWDIDKLAGMAGSIMQMSGGLLDMSVTNHKSEKVLDEKGPKILGVPTRHYAFRTSYTLSMSVMGFAQKSTVATEQEIWAGQGLNDDAIALWRRVTSFKTGIEDIDKLVGMEIGKVKGFPLKTVVASTTTDQRGRKQVTHTVTEVTEMKPYKPAAHVFKIPEGYTEEQMALPTEAGSDAKASDGNDPAAAVNSFLRAFGGRKKK